MYCKNCGKKLPDNARFCDRCNMSVRKKEGRMDLIVELKEERLARRKAKAIEERLKKIKKIRKHRRRVVIGVITGIIMIGVISGVLMYINYAQHSNFNKPIEDAPQVTDEPAATESIAVANDDKYGAVNSDGYMSADINGKEFVYPGNFALETENEEFVSYKDATGDGVIIFGTTAAESDATATMKQYQSKVIKDNAEFKVDGNAYYITGPSGNNIYHRFGCVVDGIETYYEFEYSASSAKADEYSGNIAYMDEFFKNN